MRNNKIYVALAGAAVLGWTGFALAAPDSVDPGPYPGTADTNIPSPENKSAAQTDVERAPVPTAPDNFSYDYFQMGWIVNSEYDIDNGDKLDGNGLDIAFSKSFGDYVFVHGASMTPDYRVGPTDVTLSDWVFAGPGVNLPLLRGNFPLDIWGQVSYDRIGLQGLAATGYGLATGLRFAPLPRLELNASVRYADTQGDLAGSSIDVTPLIYDLTALYHVSPRLALTAGYRGGEIEIEDAGVNQDADLSQFSLGLRYQYGVENENLPALPDNPPTSYSYAQASYVVAGEASAGGTDIDNNGGLGLEASALLAENVFVRGTVRSIDYDPAGSDVVLSDTASIGPGVRTGYAIGPSSHIDLYGQITYERLVIADAVADGYGGELGARSQIIPGVEFNAWYRYARTEFSNSQNDADPQFYGVRLILSLPNQQAWSNYALVVDYMDGFVDLDQPLNGSDELDVNALSVGIRADF